MLGPELLLTFGSVECDQLVFLVRDVPRHPDTRLFEVREAFKRSFLLLGFMAHIRAHLAIFFASGGPPGALRGPCNRRRNTNALVRRVCLQFTKLSWVGKTCKYYYEADELTNPRPAQR